MCRDVSVCLRMQKKISVSDIFLGKSPPIVTMIRMLDDPVDGDHLVCLSLSLVYFNLPLLRLLFKVQQVLK